MANVLVIGDTAGPKLAAESFEVAAAGASVAGALGETLCGALIGGNLSEAAEQFACGFKSLYLIEGAQYESYTADAYLSAAQAAIAACEASVVVFPHTLATRDWVPRLAARLATGLVMDCIALAAEGGELVVTKPVYGGGVLGEYVIRGRPRMLTIRSGVFEPLAPSRLGDVARLDVPAPAQTAVTLIDEAAAQATAGARLKDARIVVSGGRGLGGPQHWHFIEETAAALDAAVGCSRPVADTGWVPSYHQVGLSGTFVAPDLYLAVGISGAVQHLAGINAASMVVAINTDANAEIFTRAKYGVVGNCREVLPAFVQRVKELHS